MVVKHTHYDQSLKKNTLTRSVMKFTKSCSPSPVHNNQSQRSYGNTVATSNDKLPLNNKKISLHVEITSTNDTCFVH